MMTAFAAAIDCLFVDPNLSRDAVYTPSDGAPVAVRVIGRRPDEVVGFGDARLHVATMTVDLRVSEVAEPRPGDRIELDGETFLVQGEPKRDVARLVWTLDTRPA